MHVQGGYDDGAAHLTAFATTDDVFVILWRQNTAGTILGHRIISLRDVGSQSLILQPGAPAVDPCRAILAVLIMRCENEICSTFAYALLNVAACKTRECWQPHSALMALNACRSRRIKQQLPGAQICPR